MQYFAVSMYSWAYAVGYLPDQASLSNAVCLAECPSVVTSPVTCLTDSSSCLTGTITPAYPSVALGIYCIPVSSNLEGILDFNSFEQWAFDIREGWVILVISLFAAIFFSFMFLLLVR